MPLKRLDGKEKQNEVNPTTWIGIALSASAFLKRLKLFASLLLIASFFLPWASQVRGCSDGAVISESISGLSLVVENEATEALTAPIIGVVIFILAVFIVGKRRPLLRSITSLAEALSTFISTVYIDLGIFFLTNYRERYGFYIALVSLFSMSAASLTEVVTHFPLLKRKGRTVIVIILSFLILSLIISSLFKNG
ncbi:MAG: hypothetical protein JW984_05130 [Deltaproteobacteria bacterium]|uniref:Uncharacterized protein n=1 Tax=Candidatus Zymogenus saltonus TaxID=2844893 RepID=A0A9D8KEH3_9DELT|nr:hypothetical protein [Candidatus Zymogenus saltonus]